MSALTTTLALLFAGSAFAEDVQPQVSAEISVNEQAIVDNADPAAIVNSTIAEEPAAIEPAMDAMVNTPAEDESEDASDAALEQPIDNPENIGVVVNTTSTEEPAAIEPAMDSMVNTPAEDESEDASDAALEQPIDNPENIGAVVNTTSAEEPAAIEPTLDAMVNSPAEDESEDASDAALEEEEAIEDEESAEEGSATAAPSDYTVEEASPCDCGGSAPTTFDDVLFYTNSYDITDDTRYMLDALAFWLTESGTRVSISGHGDDVGSDRYNEYLGFRRVMVIKDHLISQGVDGASIEAISLGEKNPACKTDFSDECRAKNRRVSFTFTPPEEPAQ